jgi:hypothetical protein
MKKQQSIVPSAAGTLMMMIISDISPRRTVEKAILKIKVDE